jgi:hypothetical protein
MAELLVPKLHSPEGGRLALHEEGNGRRAAQFALSDTTARLQT